MTKNIEKNEKSLNELTQLPKFDSLIKPPSTSIRHRARATFPRMIHCSLIISPIKRTKILAVVICQRVQWLPSEFWVTNHQIVMVLFALNAK